MSKLADRAKAATTKDELEEIAKELDGKIVKQRGLETIRADVLLMIEESEAPAETQPEHVNPMDDVQTAAVPEVEDKRDPEPAPKKRKGKEPEHRRLKNTKNGRVFVWTADLAKKSGMVEVKGEE